MKIIIIGPAHPLRGGGISTFNERLAEVLQTQGHDVNIYSFSLQYPSFLFPGKSQFTDEPAPQGLKIITAINSINPLNWVSVGNRLKKERPDLIIVRYWLPFMGPSLGTILRKVRKNNHTRILCIADNVIPHEKRPGDAQFTKYFLKPVHAFITMSKDVLHDLQMITNKPAMFSPHPLYDNYGEHVDKQTACNKLGLNPNEPHILFFGFIRKYKGLDLLLEAMGDERIKATDIKLIVAGEFYGERKPYDDIIEKHQLQDKVALFTEFIPNDEVRYYFGATDLVVQPYRSATQSGITQTAYYFEKPMIVTKVGGLSEVVIDGKTGFITEPEPEKIADNILRFFSKRSIPNLEENMIEEKKKYSWENFTRNLLKTAFEQS